MQGRCVGGDQYIGPMTPPWFPPGADRAAFETLVEGVPPYMEQPLMGWMSSVFRNNSRSILQRYDSAAQKVSPLSPKATFGHNYIWNELQAVGELVQFIDFLVFLSEEPSTGVSRKDANALEQILEQNGSVWTVGQRDGEPGLERRMSEGVAVAASHIMAEPGHAGKLLSGAWHAAFGREPDHEKAYAQAVKAVEAASVPVVKPGDTKATLGTVIAKMRQDSDWSYPTDREHGAASPSTVLLSMLQSLWTGQNDRHAGQPDYSPTSRESAEAAVIMAVTLVQWFTSGAVARR